ncbi:hypothetical protein JCM8208_004017 [Rhodotorula glutinis]
MNRFRRKSESGRSRRKGTDSDTDRASSVLDNDPAATSTTGTDAASASPSLGLPDFGDFRHSLIMPGLARRFSLLRTDDGQLVDMDTMQSHVAKQRQTGFMTATEADALLAQHRLQAEYEAARSSSRDKTPRTKRERTDWRSVDDDTASSIDGASFLSAHGPGGAAGGRSSSATARSDDPGSTAMSPQNSLQLPYSLPGSYAPSSAATSSVSLVPSVASSSRASPSAPPLGAATSPPLGARNMSRESSSSSSGHGHGNGANGSPTTYPYQFRRGANSLFGGPTHSARDLRMAKSASSQSVASLGSKEPLELGGHVEKEEERPPAPVEDAQAARASEEEERSAARPAGEDGDQPDGAAVERPPHPALEVGDEPAGSPHPLDDDDDDDAPLDDPTSPISPVNDADFHGLSTFNAPSPTLDGDDEYVAGAHSPAASDTEAVDPFFRQMAVPPARSPPAPPSPPSRAHVDAPTLVEPVPGSSPSLRPSSPSPSLPCSSPAPPQRAPPSPPPAISIPYLPTHLRELSLEPDDDDDDGASAQTPSTALDSPSSPPLSGAFAAFALPPGSRARDVDGDAAEEEGKHGVVEGSSELSEMGPGKADETAVSDRPPFDLSLGEGEADVEVGQEEEKNEPGMGGGGDDGRHSAAAGPRHAKSDATLGAGSAAVAERTVGERRSTMTLDSTGSSFHEALEAPASDDDDPLLPHDEHEPGPADSSAPHELAAPSSPAASSRAGYLSASSRPHSLSASQRSGPSPDLELDAAAGGLRPMSLPLYRQASNELHQVLASALGRDLGGGAAGAGAGEEGPGGGLDDSSDLILQDLLAIQDRLVQSAARRAANQSPRSPGQMSQEGAGPGEHAREVEEDEEEDGDEADLANPFEPTSPLRIRKRETTDSTATATASAAALSSTSPSSPSRPPPRQDWSASTDSMSDLGGALAGLGLTSLSTRDYDDDELASPMSSSSAAAASGQRASYRMSSSAQRSSLSRRPSDHPQPYPHLRSSLSRDDRNYDRDSSLYGGPASTAMTMQTSQASSSSPFTYSAVTPSSTTQSDAFEFSSLVGSPETTSLADGAEHQIREGSFASGSDQTESSPQMDDAGGQTVVESGPAAGDEAPTAVVESAAFEESAGGAASSSRPTPPSLSAATSSALGEAAPIDTQSFLRVPRTGVPRRDPSKTTSMLVRDVRNQATLATIALKTQSPGSPPTKPLSKTRSVRKMSISSPQLVSGPINIPAVPIASPQVIDSSRFRVSRSKSRKAKEESAGGGGGPSGSIGKSTGLGSRFKTLLKKQQSRDQLAHLNGDEVTPFVAANAAVKEPRVRTSGIPITPPNQSIAQFESPSSSLGTPTSSDGSHVTPRQGRSPAYRPPSGLRTLGEVAEQRSSVVSSSDSPHSSGSRPSGSSGHTRTLSRGSPLATARHSEETSVEREQPVEPVKPASPDKLVAPVSTEQPTLRIPASPSLHSVHSLVSGQSSEYAGSFIDFYAHDPDEDDDEPPASPFDEAALAQAYEGFDSLHLSQHGSGLHPSSAAATGGLSVDEQLALQHELDLTARLRPVSEFEEHPEFGNAYGPAPGGTTTASPALSGGPEDEIVWQVLDDLRSNPNRDSVVSKNSSFGFSSGNSSVGLDDPQPGASDGAADANAIANMLRHRNRQRSSAGSSMPSEWDGRYPSVYFREEQALIQLGEEGGVAPEAEGRFLVRPRGELAPEVPPVPEQYRGQWVAKAGARDE